MQHTTSPEALTTERAMLVRFCNQYTGNPDVAEDLAQQTLLEAWRHEDQLQNPDARRGWLFSIARNSCLMWARARGRELSRRIDLSKAGEHRPDIQLADQFDLEMDVEREDLARLLDRAMALLPPETRDALVWKYVEESPQAEIAARLGISEGAVEARLHRGKLALKKVLTTTLSDEAVEHGLISNGDAGWQQTRIWCPGCGKHRLECWFRPREGQLYMRCPDCPSTGAHLIHSDMGDGFAGLRSYRPAVSRVLGVIHEMFRVRAAVGVTGCPGCGEQLPITRGTPPWVPPGYADPASVYLWHPRCGGYDSETWHSLTWSLPEARRFWKEHPRMRYLPERDIEFGGSPAVVTGFESVTSSARLEVVSLRDTLEVVSINGSERAESASDG